MGEEKMLRGLNRMMKERMENRHLVKKKLEKRGQMATRKSSDDGVGGKPELTAMLVSSPVFLVPTVRRDRSLFPLDGVGSSKEPTAHTKG